MNLAFQLSWEIHQQNSGKFRSNRLRKLFQNCLRRDEKVESDEIKKVCLALFGIAIYLLPAFPREQHQRNFILLCNRIRIQLKSENIMIDGNRCKLTKDVNIRNRSL